MNDELDLFQTNQKRRRMKRRSSPEFSLLSDTNETYLNEFWAKLDHLITTAKIEIDRPKGSTHPRYPEIIYPLDYGYLAGTSSGDGDGIDIWLGTNSPQTLNAFICSVDLMKRDVELKLLLGCTEKEMETILAFHNDKSQAAMLIRRG